MHILARIRTQASSVSQKREIRGEIMEISRIRVFNKKGVKSSPKREIRGGVVAISRNSVSLKRVHIHFVKKSSRNV